MPKPIPDHGDGLARLAAVVLDLRGPGGCPWDREQTHESLTSNMIEEAYEAVEALRSGDPAWIREELGDVLLQVVLHAAIADEAGAFDLQGVAHGIADKLIRRHPHVYGDSQAATTGAVLAQWDAIKQGEKGGRRGSLLDGVGKGLPALSRAAKLQRKAAGVGFDWPDSAGVLAKIREELAEVEAEAPGTSRRAAEIGDLLFSVANLARKEGLDPEILCATANDTFASRFARMENDLRNQGRELGTVGLDDMEAAWQQVKLADDPVAE